jgi:hypothetical protein
MHNSLARSTIIALGLAAAATAVGSSTITASFDTKGHHPATAAIKRAATILCASANSNQGSPAACYIVAPGVSRQVLKGQSVGASGAGTVTLTCDGQGTLVRCSANILD